MRSVLVHQQVTTCGGSVLVNMYLLYQEEKKVILTWENEELCIHAANDSYDINSGN